MNLLQVGQLSEGDLITEGDVDETMVNKGAHGGDSGRLLTTAGTTRRDEETGILAPVATSGPDGACPIPEGLPLCREVAVTSGDTEQDGVVLEKIIRLCSRVVRLGRGVHLCQNIVGEGLGNSKKVSIIVS